MSTSVPPPQPPRRPQWQFILAGALLVATLLSLVIGDFESMTRLSHLAAKTISLEHLLPVSWGADPEEPITNPFQPIMPPFIEAAAAAGEVTRGISFPELRRCLLGSWPPAYDGEDLEAAAPDPAACISSLASSAPPLEPESLRLCTGDPSLGSEALRAALRRYVVLTRMRGYTRSVLTSPEEEAVAADGDVSLANLVRYDWFRGSGGLGDKGKGLAVALHIALASTNPRYMLIDGDNAGRSELPKFTLALRPCPGLDGHNWVVPSRWDAQLSQPPFGALRLPHGNSADAYTNWDGLTFTNAPAGPHFTFRALNNRWEATDRMIAAATATNATAPLVSIVANMLSPIATNANRNPLMRGAATGTWAWGEWLRRDLSLELEDKYAAFIGRKALQRVRDVPACRGLPAELAGLFYGDSVGFECAAGLVDRAYSGANATSLSVLPSAGGEFGPGNNNLLFRLLDWMVWPTPAFVNRLLEGTKLLSLYKPQLSTQYVISLHLRVGTPANGADYSDPERTPFATLMTGAAECADAALQALVEEKGGRSEVLWYIASDRPDAITKMRDLAAERQREGKRPQSVADIPVTVGDLALSSIMHTDSSAALNAPSAESKWTETFIDMFMLSASHAMVRSRSGFSEGAAGWGGIPVVFRLTRAAAQCVRVGEFHPGEGWD